MKAKSASILKYLLIALTLIVLSSTAKAQLKADFSSNITKGCAPIIVQFKDSSSGNPTSWKWDLGNGTISFLQNPSVSYINPGVYNIKLVVKKGNQEDSITKSQFITVYDLPNVEFTASNRGGCYPLKTQFTDLSTSNNSSITNWLWDFGDGNTSTQQNPFYTYNNDGNFSVKLKVTNSNGCFKVIGKNSYITVQGGVHANFTYASAGTCAPPTPVNFTNTSTSSGGLTYQWFFGDNGVSTDANPTHNYTTNGSYTVTLVAINNAGCKDTMVKANAVNVGTVHADFNLPQTTICAGAPLTISNTSTPATVSSTWSFGDGTVSNLINPTTSYNVAGTYSIKLVNSFGSCIDSIEKSITVLPKPTAQFSAINNIGCTAPLQVQFVNNSTGGVSYYWEFGDGNNSNLQNPTYTYLNSGDYNIKLVIQGGNGCYDSLVKSNYVSVRPPKIQAITNDPKEGCVPLPVTFQSVISSTQNVATYEWDFGDGTTSTDSVPNHIYTTEGVFSVKLKITTIGGCTDTLTLVDAVKAGHKPKAEFSASPRISCPDQPVAFTDLSTNGPIDKWKWQFGDGNASPVQNPSNNYKDTGYMNVKLIVWSNGCSDTLIKAKYVYINPPVARFKMQTDCSSRMKVAFIDSSIMPITYNWDFGDGSSSTQANPIHTYSTAGVYSVILTVENGGCTSKTMHIATVDDKVGVLKITDVACRNEAVSFLVDSVSAVNPPVSYDWYFTINTLYAYPYNNFSTRYVNAGHYPASVVIHYENGCQDSLVSAVGITIHGAKPDFKSLLNQYCKSSVINFTDSSTTDGIHPISKWIWNYGDGIIDTLAAAPFSHSYTTGGNYNVQLTVIDSYGCIDSVYKPNAVKVSQLQASFVASDTLVCPSTSVQFTNNSVGTNITYNWSLGDGTVVNGNNLTNHHYASTGLYGVKLKVTTQTGCTDSILIADAVKIVPTPRAVIKSDTAVCKNEYLQFSASLVNADTSAISWYWSFGNGNTSNLQNPPAQQYLNSGTYTLINKVTNSSGCESLITKNITVNVLPIVSVGPDTTICRNQSVLLSASGANSYIWSGNTSTLSCVTCASPIAKPLTNITYVVTGKNGFNCISRDTVNVIVKQPSKLNVIKGDTLCLGETLTVKATGTEMYNWYPNIYLDNTNTNTVNIHPTKDTLIKYMLIGKDDRNCFRDTAYVSIKTYPIPKFDILQSSLTLNAGAQVNLQTNNSADITSWKWYPSKFLDNPTRSNPVLTAKEDITYICVAENDGHCSAKDEVKVIVICNGGNVFLPNTFSPNGDGNNDVFYPRGKGIYGVKSLRIFNRWGEMVFERTNFNANDISSGWDGTYKGVKLPSDAYVYTVELMCDNNNTIPAKGSITLLR